MGARRVVVSRRGVVRAVVGVAAVGTVACVAGSGAPSPAGSGPTPTSMSRPGPVPTTGQTHDLFLRTTPPSGSSGGGVLGPDEDVDPSKGDRLTVTKVPSSATLGEVELDVEDGTVMTGTVPPRRSGSSRPVVTSRPVSTTRPVPPAGAVAPARAVTGDSAVAPAGARRVGQARAVSSVRGVVASVSAGTWGGAARPVDVRATEGVQVYAGQAPGAARVPREAVYRGVNIDESLTAALHHDAMLGRLLSSQGPVTGQVGTITEAPSPRPLPRPSNPNVGGLSREQIRVRAKSWLDAHVPYCQTEWYTNRFGTYRMDCSGFVSMAWAAREFYTGDVLEQARVIGFDDLRPGDALFYHAHGNKGHIMLFMGWARTNADVAIIWHSSSEDGTCPHRFGVAAATYTRGGLLRHGYTPIRYDRVRG